MSENEKVDKQEKEAIDTLNAAIQNFMAVTMSEHICVEWMLVGGMVPVSEDADARVCVINSPGTPFWRTAGLVDASNAWMDQGFAQG